MIKIKDLHVNIEDKEILKGINLCVNPGELHVIMGRNGTGKSSLANVMAGKNKYQIKEVTMEKKNQLNNIEKIFSKSNNVNDFASGYFRYLQDILNRIDLDSLGRVVKEFEDARGDKKTIFIAGNGGSAATATAMANDIKYPFS